MINAAQLLSDLTRLLKCLEGDLLQRIEEVPALKSSLQAEWQAARDADRCAETFETWADQAITQAGVHWLLSCVFLRFIEDNQLVDRPWLGGMPESGRLALARDRHEAYFRERPLESDRDYLLASFREAGALPGLHTFFDEAHNPVFRLGLSGDAAMALRQFWQQVDPNTGTLVHDFTDPDGNTRFLGDLYQDLSEATRKRYALLQTPEFIEEFILDRTLTPALHEFGYREVRLIDPTCGSGHFLLGSFRRLVDEWVRHEPVRNPRDIAQKALDAIAGVDLNPFAIAISRFRLLVAALKVSGVHRLSEAPDFKLNVAIGDSLLHGKRFGMTATDGMFEGAEDYAGTGLAHAYASEDLMDVQRILGRQYHAVVGNPPYITVKDPALNAAYRRRYASCHMKYSLGVPFTERVFDLALTGSDQQPGGFVGLITTNSFMKREFGKRLVAQFLPTVDIQTVVDTRNAYIPGHGTATVIMFGRNRQGFPGAVRLVLSKRAEAQRPVDPSNAPAWRAIVDQIDRLGSSSTFVDVIDTPRETLRVHPWMIGGTEELEVLKRIEEASQATLADLIDEIGFGCVISEEEAFFETPMRRHQTSGRLFRDLVVGDDVRDWIAESSQRVLFPYNNDIDLINDPELLRCLWPLRSTLASRRAFGNATYEENGRPWWEYHQIPVARNRAPRLICFAFISTQNNFAISNGGKVFGRTAPIMMLPRSTGHADHLALVEVLNSSVASFWMKMNLVDKGGGGIGGGLATEAWEKCFEFDGGKLKRMPALVSAPSLLAIEIDQLISELRCVSPAAAFTRGEPDYSRLMDHKARYSNIQSRLIAIQEEIDWRLYSRYGLCDASLQAATSPAVRLGERAFEIVLARRMAAGDEQTAWFERHGSTPITEIPSHWPEDYRQVVQRRIDLIEHDRNIVLIERPEYKRRWNIPPWEDLERVALRGWLLDRLESPHLWSVGEDHPPKLTTVNRLADAVRTDADFIQIAELYAGHSSFDVGQIMNELVANETVPFLPVLRYTESGLRKRAQWEDIWALQRREDAGEKVGNIPVPPKYQSKDFLKADVWRLRGRLDVPKERWISYPGCERGADTSLPIVWAGWNHLQQATALAAYYVEMKDTEGWEPARLQPLLAGLLELVPWLEQWHNELDPVFGEHMGDYYRGVVSQEARELGFTLDDLRAWKPAVAAAKRGHRKAS
ncbi:BREX-2 system adenine-specific DNA-methyltransferase PglX [Nitrosospira multiformis]|uniref:BREX-2 system adenine-specific DNA-methyltransferase PglX n=1 Tax=Nitrosospira multiformis TaxID=1231 RepID=UPI00089B4C26|nr:BREX-2 system adenine-specific DNA-methyltransferase PglX [Nitrosospira multiformis]SEA51052.1 hypothetical protein SAMN05216411_11122 [Nitrosospira multiformis]